MVKNIILYFIFLFLIPVIGNAATEELDTMELFQTRVRVHSQQELEDFVKKDKSIHTLEVKASENWKIIDMNLDGMKSQIFNLKFLDFNYDLNDIVGMSSFHSQQSKLGNNNSLSIHFRLDTTNKNSITSSTLTLPISKNWPKIGSLGTSGYDTLNVPFSFMARQIIFFDPICFSEESFRNLTFNTLYLKYNLDVNKEIVGFIGFHNESTSYKLLDTLYSKHNYWYSKHYEIEVECSDSISADYFLKTFTPIFLATPHGESLSMTVGVFPLDLEFKLRAREPQERRNYKNIKCVNNFPNHTFLINEISKIDYANCTYAPNGLIPCADLKLFDQTKHLVIYFDNHTLLERIAMRWCLRKHKDLRIDNLTKY